MHSTGAYFQRMLVSFLSGLVKKTHERKNALNRRRGYYVFSIPEWSVVSVRLLYKEIFNFAAIFVTTLDTIMSENFSVVDMGLGVTEQCGCRML